MVAGYRWIFRAGVYTGSIWFCICSTVRPHDASQRRLSSLTRSARISLSSRSSICTSTGGNTTLPSFAAGLLKRIRQAAALRFRQLTGGGFNSDEWREAPRLINRLDAGSVVLYCGRPVAVPAVPGSLAVSVTATSSPRHWRSGPVHAPPKPVFATPTVQRVVKIATFDQRLFILCPRVAHQPEDHCRNGTGVSAHHPCG